MIEKNEIYESDIARHPARRQNRTCAAGTLGTESRRVVGGSAGAGDGIFGSGGGLMKITDTPGGKAPALMQPPSPGGAGPKPGECRGRNF